VDAIDLLLSISHQASGSTPVGEVEEVKYEVVVIISNKKNNNYQQHNTTQHNTKLRRLPSLSTRNLFIIEDSSTS
jgi:beta-lactamase superfamily II metal-dependent hydrolase